MVVERLTLPPSGFRDVSARLGLGECPSKGPGFEEVVQDAFESLGRLVPSSAWVRAADAADDPPNRDRGKVDSLGRDPVQELGQTGSGLGRIISDTTRVSSSRATSGFRSRPRRKRGVAGSRGARAGAAPLRVVVRSNA